MTSGLKVLSGIDLPADAVGGSVELFADLYLRDDPAFEGRFFMLEPRHEGGQPSERLDLFDGIGGRTDFTGYVGALTRRVAGAFSNFAPDVLHLHHVAFGASLALLRAFPTVPSVALVHGTDLIAAIEDSTQRTAMGEIVAAADIVVVPTTAMATLLTRIIGDVGELTLPIERVPWGIPDAAFTSPTRRNTCVGSPPQLLFAGRVSPEKGLDVLLRSTGVGQAVLSITADQSELPFDTIPPGIRALGWQQRKDLWRRFDEFDALLVPSVSVEAFGLTAVEAQARGLPVIYQPTSGLLEVVGESGLAIDFRGDGLYNLLRRDAHELAQVLQSIRGRGFTNAATYTMGAMSRSLQRVSQTAVEARQLRT
jgi:glycosyltransferase involved in cell wall biosynthesis